MKTILSAYFAVVSVLAALVGVRTEVDAMNSYLSESSDFEDFEVRRRSWETRGRS